MYIKRKFLNLILVTPGIQYFYYYILGFVKQIISLFVKNKISSNVDCKMLFIVGSGRSGNTLFRKLLMENGDIYIPPESYVLANEVITYLNSKSLNWGDRVELCLAKLEYYPEFSTFEIEGLREFAVIAKKWPKDKQFTDTIVYELYHWIARKKGVSVSWVGDKTPLNTLHLGLIKKLFPKAVYVYLQRDGVDVAYSYVSAKIYNNIADAAMRWKYSRLAWLRFKKGLKKSSYIEIRYEELVENHEKLVCDVLSKFGIPKNKSTEKAFEFMGDVSVRMHHDNVKNTPNNSSIGKGRKLLNYNDKFLLKKIINKDLIDAGYGSL